MPSPPNTCHMNRMKCIVGSYSCKYIIAHSFGPHPAVVGVPWWRWPAGRASRTIALRICFTAILVSFVSKDPVALVVRDLFAGTVALPKVEKISAKQE